MPNRPVYKVDAFTRTPLQGNPAGVLSHARGLTSPEMLAIAREVNMSETAFVFPSTQADLLIRFFTPTQEVPFCGHALVATLIILEELGEICVEGDFARVQVETGVGVLSADLVRTPEGLRVDLIQAEPAFRDCTVPLDLVAEVLGADLPDLRTDLPLELAYTGLWSLVVPLGDADALDGLLPDYRGLATLNRELGVLTTYAFVEEEGEYHCRCFAPAAGIDEDPVTGSASGSLGAYLVRHRCITPGEPVMMYQGQACGRPGELRVVVGGEPGAPRRVTVGGHAMVSMRGQILTGKGA